MPTVLVVDDEADIRNLLTDIITDNGFLVIQAGDGQTAVQRARTDRPDLILLDVWMLGQDGFKVLDQLKESPATRDIPVVLLTAMSPLEGEKEGLEAGVSHYIHKPWENGVVEATVRVALRERQAREKNGAEDESADLPVDSDTVDINTPDTRIFQEPRALAGLRSGRRRRPGGPQLGDRIRTADRLNALEQRMGGGLPVPSLNLAVGATGSGKSVLCEHMAYGALMDGFEVCYFTSEHTRESLVTQMNSLGLDVDRYLNTGLLQVHAVPDPIEGEDNARVLAQLATGIEQLAGTFQFLIIDSISDLVGSCPEQNVIAFFSAGRRLTGQGKAVLISLHPYVFGVEMFARLKTLCDGYFSLNSEQIMGRPMRTIEINKINTTEITTENLVSFVVEPEVGMRVIPLSKSKA